MNKLICFLLLASASAAAQSIPAHLHWTGTWAASQQIPEPQNSLAPADLEDATLRQVVHLSLGGSYVRVRLSNAFGTAPLHFTAVHIARSTAPGTSHIDSATDIALTFNGQRDVTIPAGAEYVSDPVAFAAAPLSSLAVTFHLEAAPAQETGHPGSRATSYYEHGNQVAAAEMPQARTVDHWYELSGVEVGSTAPARCVVALGDSITDGHATEPNRNQRWTDVLAARLQANRRTKDVCVLNEGIGGNRLLHYGLGPDAMARLDRDVLAQAGARYVIVLEGVNDLGTLTRDHPATAEEHHALVEQMEAAFQQIIDRAHAHEIEAIGGTIMPYTGSDYYHPGPESEADRQAINDWIRAAGHFDRVIDFDKIMRDPAQPDRLNPAYDSGDHLHPGPAGYQAMANAIPLQWFTSK